jgi:hypothetical protein
MSYVYASDEIFVTKCFRGYLLSPSLIFYTVESVLSRYELNLNLPNIFQASQDLKLSQRLKWIKYSKAEDGGKDCLRNVQ